MVKWGGYNTSMTDRKQRTIDQRIAEAELKIARLGVKKRKLENGQKFVVGGLFLQLAREDAAIRQLVIDLLTKHVQRDADIRRIAPLLDELRSMPDG